MQVYVTPFFLTVLWFILNASCVLMSAWTRLNVDGRLRVKTSTKRRCRFWGRGGGWEDSYGRKGHCHTCCKVRLTYSWDEAKTFRVVTGSTWEKVCTLVFDSRWGMMYIGFVHPRFIKYLISLLSRVGTWILEEIRIILYKPRLYSYIYHVNFYIITCLNT